MKFKEWPLARPAGVFCYGLAWRRGKSFWILFVSAKSLISLASSIVAFAWRKLVEENLIKLEETMPMSGNEEETTSNSKFEPVRQVLSGCCLKSELG